ncbi:unnamed protein product [Schistosoma margrebowiei]|uniref:Uncharacterized protein n=1 Tax=Schistosoma margrebowiei TaxID=48269 RepID=A0A183LJH2_9TREM|nr:unnamed protein product [Schistosoma margrebowiei]
MMVGGSQQETLHPGFVLLGTRHQSVPVISRELMLLDGFNTVSPSSTCFKCGDTGHIQSVCSINVHFIATNIKTCNSDSTRPRIYNDDLSLSTIEIDGVESHSSSELNETQNSRETTVSNQSIYQISHVIVLNMAFSNDSLIPEEILCKSEKNVE